MIHPWVMDNNCVKYYPDRTQVGTKLWPGHDVNRRTDRQLSYMIRELHISTVELSNLLRELSFLIKDINWRALYILIIRGFSKWIKDQTN